MNITAKTNATQFLEMSEKILNEYKISNFHKELAQNFISNGIPKEKLSNGLDNFNIIEEFIGDTQVRTDMATDVKSKLLCQIKENERKIFLETFSQNFQSVYEKYRYMDCMKKLHEARNQFDFYRKRYVFQQFLQQMEHIFIQGNVAAEEAFIRSIELNFEFARRMGSFVECTYEDLDGSEKTILVSNRDDADVILEKQENGEDVLMTCYSPEDYWIGSNCFTGFRIHYMWDLNEEEWIPVPIHLIKKFVSIPISESYLEEFDLDEDTEDWQ